MKIKIEDLKFVIGWLSKINNAPLEAIEWAEHNKKLDIPPKLIAEFELKGLNNTDFITSGYYLKDGKTHD